MWNAYFCMGAYKDNVVVVIKMVPIFIQIQMVRTIEFSTCTLHGAHFLVLYLSRGKGIF